jgi:hypothetical protein
MATTTVTLTRNAPHEAPPVRAGGASFLGSDALARQTAATAIVLGLVAEV